MTTKPAIKVVAIAPLDGWAFLLKDDTLFLLRPPYTKSDLIKSSKEEVASALKHFPFQTCDQVFDSFSQVISFLRDAYVKAVEQLGVALPEPDELKGLLKYAESDIIDAYLTQMETDFIPNRLFQVAENLALELLRLKRVRESETFYSRSLDVIQVCRDSRTVFSPMASNSERLGEKFPKAVGKYTREAIDHLSRHTRQKGQLMPVGA